MPLSTNHRSDRRRRVIRESIAADSDFAVESARAARRTRRLPAPSDEEYLSGYRDPGYSQSVRKISQHRLVQLIPVRPASLALTLACLWGIWAGLILGHYWFHVRANEGGRSNVLFLQLFDIRSPHSIANWMTCQLWMLTALVAWMIYQIRQHKLDDFRAKYRVWVLLSGVALFSSFDASTSCLYLLGQSIDGWTKAEIGYGGWPLVLATYASLIGLMGIRLSSELKSTPSALVLWYGGLMAWAGAALLGTGLLKLEWSPGSIDIAVGACWLGGVLAVFQAAGLVLRHCYLQAQKRFLERTALAPSPNPLRLPGFGKKPKELKGSDSREAMAEGSDLEERTSVFRSIAGRLGFSLGRPDDASAIEDATSESDDEETGESTDNRRSTQASRSSKSKSVREAEVGLDEEPKRSKRLFGFIPNRQERNALLADEEALREDDGGDVDMGLTKKPGWFGFGAKAGKPQSQSSATQAAKTSSTDSNTNAPSASKAAAEGEVKEVKKSWLPSFGRKGSVDESASEGLQAKQTKGASSAPLGGSKQESKAVAPKEPSRSVSADASVAAEAKSIPKRGWLTLGKRRHEETDGSIESSTKTTKKKTSDGTFSEGKKGLGSRIAGWFDGLRLRPPVDRFEDQPGTPKQTVNTSNASTKETDGTSQKPVPVSPNSSSRPLPSTQSQSTNTNSNYSDQEDEDPNENRHLSKAERKRLRRMQQDRDAA
jgi:hypothetical protein